VHDNTTRHLTLITGAARSGKSELAETLAAGSDGQVYYLATMQRWEEDREGVSRIERHRQRRPGSWVTVEVGRELDVCVRGLPAGPGFVLIDCLSVYVSNLLLDGFQEGDDPYTRADLISQAIERLLAAIDERRDLEFVAVTNEVGWGVVPSTPLGRAYRDLLGLANQAFAHRAHTVWLMCSGLKLRLR